MVTIWYVRDQLEDKDDVAFYTDTDKVYEHAVRLGKKRVNLELDSEGIIIRKKCDVNPDGSIKIDKIVKEWFYKIHGSDRPGDWGCPIRIGNFRFKDGEWSFRDIWYEWMYTENDKIAGAVYDYLEEQIKKRINNGQYTLR